MNGLHHQTATGNCGRWRDVDIYLGTLLIYGARAVIRVAVNKAQHAGSWLAGVIERRIKNMAAVALANKNALIIWALLVHDQNYEGDYGLAA